MKEHNHPTTYVGIGLLLDTSLGRRICMGINKYAREKQGWRLIDLKRNKLSEELFKGSDRHGVIMHLINSVPQLPKGTPIVNVGARCISLPVPTVVTDNEAVGRLVASHFVDRGFTSLAFLGYEGIDFSKLRLEGFCSVAREAGATVETKVLSELGGWSPQTMADIIAWLREMPKPVGLMIVQDYLAYSFITSAVDAELDIPSEIALVSVDSDEILCELAEVPLSSVSPPLELLGYRAAALLDSLMDGGSEPDEPILIPPGVVETRASSDVLATADPVVRRAVSIIHSNSNTPLTVQSLAKTVHASRRYLERHFHLVLGRTPHQEIARVRLERAKKLLLQSSLSLGEVAVDAGFREVKTMAAALKAAEGMTPGEFRRIHQSGVFPETRARVAGKSNA